MSKLTVQLTIEVTPSDEHSDVFRAAVVTEALELITADLDFRVGVVQDGDLLLDKDLADPSGQIANVKVTVNFQN